IADYSPSAFLIKFVLLLLTITFLVLGLANLQAEGRSDNVKRKGVDVMIALDVSKSMLATDIKPDRLSRAKQLITRLVNQLPEDRIGIILFAGRAYLQMPLSTDHGAALMYIQQAGPESVPTQGTVISEALKLSAQSFNSKERKYKSIVLITDGEDHDPEAMQLTKDLAASGVVINTVGVGSPDGATIIDPSTGDVKKDVNGNTVVSKLNETELKILSAQTNGTYTLLDDPDAAIGSIMKQLSLIEQTAMEDKAFRDYTSYFQWFLAAALLLLLMEFFMPERKWRRRK
ncbi:MAG TPA: VWA domain-containing protein, partial [Flavitalea sp.]|nr:VWA domain-containing protein [Flavitalea sp.]